MHNTHTPLCPSDIHTCVYACIWACIARVSGTGNTIHIQGWESVKHAWDGG